MKILRFDTEFRGSSNHFVTPVAAIVQIDTQEFRYWFPADLERFKADWRGWMSEGFYIVCFYGSAETRFLQAAGFTVKELLRMKWLDVWIYWRMATHSNVAYKFGPKVIVEGTTRKWIITTPAPDGVVDDVWEEDETGKVVIVKKVQEKHKPVGGGLAAAVAHRLGQDLDTEHKSLMREIIITRTEYTEDEKESILSYCSSDVDYLQPLLENLQEVMTEETKGRVTLDSLEILSRYSVCCGIMESFGIPIFVEKAMALGANYGEADRDLIRSCNNAYPFYVWTKCSKVQKSKGMGDFYWKEDYKGFMAFIEACGMTHVWPKSESGKLRRDKDTLKEYRGDPVIETLRTCKKSRSQLKYFRPEGFSRIQRNLGSDGRIRVLLSPYGSKTGRNQPSVANGYMFGMSTWLRTLIGAPGKVIVGADFSAEEIAIQAWASGDVQFMEAYKSSDPYCWMAVFAGAFPEGTKKTKQGYVDADGNLVDAATQASYRGIRETFKALMLGIGFGMGLEKLATKMTQNRINALPKEDQELLAKARFSSEPALLNRAAEILDATKVVPGFWHSDTDADYPELQRASTYTQYHREFFAAYWAWRESVVESYRENGFYSLVDGWSLLEGEVRDTSVGNFPVQGMGGCILRRAVERCLWAGLEVIAPLHDCVYVVSDPDKAEEDAATLVREMKMAVVDLCGSDFIRIEPKIYATDWVNYTSTWTEEKQSREFRDFGKYMDAGVKE